MNDFLAIAGGVLLSAAVDSAARDQAVNRALTAATQAAQQTGRAVTVQVGEVIVRVEPDARAYQVVPGEITPG